ncbi:MAG: hypothetical protein JSS74_03585 [Actinobacteria bacterium]|nr:hypothetical protein [Actinomycetota bacterium]
MGTAFIVLAIAATLILVGVLVASGVAKLRTPDDAEGWAELGIPAVLRQEWLIRLHPWAEIALAVVLLLFGGWIGTAAAIIAVLLFGAYLVMVWRAKNRTPDASCACFGERQPITARTLLRNGWLVLLALIAAVGIGALPLAGGVLLLAVAQWPWTLALAAVAVTFVLVRETGSGSAGAARTDEAAAVVVPDDELEDYLRTRTPAIPVQLGDGTTTTLRELASAEPVLLLAVSETCGSCTPVIESVDAYRALLPEVSVRLLLQNQPENSTLRSTEEPQTVHDPDRYVGLSFADSWFTPSAVLLGADGLLAGGPVTGTTKVAEFVDDIYESLHGERPPAR